MWNETTKKLETLTNPTLEKFTFWGKEFEVKRLSIKAILKIASIIWSLSSANSIIDMKTEKINLSVLDQINDEDINELIALILKTDKKEVEELFNITDFIKLVKVVIKQEDVKGLFLEVSQLTEVIQTKAEKQ